MYVQETNGKVHGADKSLRTHNRIRLASITVKKLMKREDVRRIMGCSD